MLKRKTPIVGAVAVMLISSVLGATALRTPGAEALDALGKTEAVLEDIGDRQEATIELAAPSLVGGISESLILVVAAQVPAADVERTLQEVNAPFGELQGFSFDSSDQYELTGLYVRTTPDTLDVPCSAETDCPEGLSTIKELQPVDLQLVQLGADSTLPAAARTDFSLVTGQTLLLSAFRTKQGAEEFMEFAQALGVTDLVAVQALKLGGGDIGLGQEPHPDGSGPLLGPLGDQEAFQQ